MVLSAPEFAHHIGPQSLTEICLSALKRCLSLANVLPLLELCQHVDFIRDALHAAFVGFLVSTFEVVLEQQGAEEVKRALVDDIMFDRLLEEANDTQLRLRMMRARGRIVE
mmetsp:Transcript_8576/g.25745  ORF Transcript_8576/g.25745 Transcript_8576/m.25745 type:complete len:111 (-) Transcript_8576:6-338(-)